MLLSVEVKKSVGYETLNVPSATFFCLFSDRAGSISTLDSLDFARYSDDGNRESDERVAGKMNPTDGIRHKSLNQLILNLHVLWVLHEQNGSSCSSAK